MLNKNATKKQLVADNKGLSDQLEQAEASLRDMLSGEADALFVSGTAGAEIFAVKGTDQAYRILIENMGEGALTLTPNGLILYANRRFAEILRVPLEKVIGSEIYNWFAPESRQVVQTLLLKDIPNRHSEELILVAKGETQVPVFLSVNRIVLDKEPDAYCMVVTDLTEQKRNEAILAEEKFARAILEQAADVIIICDESGRIMRASKQAQMFNDKNLIGQQFSQAFPLRRLDGTVISPDTSTNVSSCQSLEVRLEHNAREFYFLISIGYLKNTQTKLLGSVVTLTDITENLLAVNEIRSISKFSSENPNPVLRILENGTLVYANYSAKPILTKWKLEVGQKVPKTWQKLIVTSFSSGISKEVEIKCERHIFSCFLVPILSEKYVNIYGFDITDRKQTEATRDRLAAILESTTDLVITGDPKGHLMHINRAAYTTLGLGLEEDITQMKVADFISNSDDDNPGLTKGIPIAIREGSWSGETILINRSGLEIPVSQVILAHKDSNGEIDFFSTIMRDITEQKKSIARIAHLNRVYSMLSGINTLIVHANDHDELYKEACRIAVEAGGFYMSMICIVDKHTRRIVPASSAGKDKDFLDNIKNYLSSKKDVSKTMLARAIIGKKAIVSNDSENDPQVLFGKQYKESGVCSIVVLPLIISDEAVGAIALYASEINSFQEEELKLLTALADDIAYAIDHINKQEQLNYLAYYDELTGLANRTLFLERVTQYMRSADSQGHKLALVLIDIERFRNINDSLGRTAGDKLLKQMSEWLTQFAQDANLLARIDADHFAFVVPEVKSEGDLAMLVDNMTVTFLEHSYDLNGAMFRINIKLGITIFPDDSNNADILYRNAEAALKKAKVSGDRFLFYTQKMTAAVVDQLTLENKLRQAIDNEEFVLHYQPKVNLISGKITSAEALIRWNDPRTGLVPPAMFIPILEETGMIYQVGRWALQKAIEDNMRWRAAGLLPAVRIAVNVSALQLRNINFIDEIRQVISVDEDAVDALELEITESLIMEDVRLNITSLRAIHALGVTIAIDDFGTGFSSLSYLAKLPVDTLKIDHAFVIAMDKPEGMALVSNIIILAHALKLKVVAEGVETEQQSRQLLTLNCDEMQGFLFSKPVPAEIFEARFLATITAR